MTEQTVLATDSRPEIGYELLESDPRRLDGISIKRRLRPGHVTLAESAKPLPFFGVAPGRQPNSEPVLLTVKVARFVGADRRTLGPIADNCLAEEKTWARAEDLFHSAGEDATYRWVARRFIQGVPMNRLDATTGVELKRLYADYLLAEIAQLHTSGEAHLDIKPSNVIVTPTRTWLIDFESSRDADASTSLPMLTTASFASPEQVLPRPGRRVGPPSDLFSWGLTVVSMFRPDYHPYCEGRFDPVALAALGEAPGGPQKVLDLGCIPDPALREAVRRALGWAPELRPPAPALRQQLSEHATAVIPEMPVTVVIDPADFAVAEPWWRTALRYAGPDGPFGDKHVPALVRATAYLGGAIVALFAAVMMLWLIGVVV